MFCAQQFRMDWRFQQCVTFIHHNPQGRLIHWALKARAYGPQFVCLNGFFTAYQPYGYMVPERRDAQPSFDPVAPI